MLPKKTILEYIVLSKNRTSMIFNIGTDKISLTLICRDIKTLKINHKARIELTKEILTTILAKIVLLIEDSEIIFQMKFRKKAALMNLMQDKTKKYLKIYNKIF